MRRILSLAMAIALVAIGLAPTAVFAAGANDDFHAAQAVTSFPFSDSPDLTGATTQADEPQACYSAPNTVWYAITAPGNGTITAVSSRFDVNLVIYAPINPGITGLLAVRCAAFSQQLQLPVTTGATYYIQVGSYNGYGGTADLSINFVPPPANDDFASATVIGSVPFSATTNMAGSTLEPGEPLPNCYFGPRDGSIWYKFTPSVTASVTASVSAGGLRDVTFRRGSSVGSLVELACGVFPPVATIKAEAGVTYYIGVTASGDLGPTTLSLALASPPVAAFATTVSDPSAFDTITFVDQSSDPGNAGITSQAWAFGDGSTATGNYVLHRYATDGDYQVTLTVTTVDGRVGTLTRTISVRTHDIAVAKMTAPNAASSGQTRTITVGISNHRYPETVLVTLTKATPYGSTYIGSILQTVPVRSANRTTDVTFSYTFAADDAAIGKVTFQATAYTQTSRDAFPGDNVAQSFPTKVGK